MRTCIEPDIIDSLSSFDLIVVLIELVNVFNEPVLVSIESTRFFKLRVVVETDEDKLTIEPDKVFVVVATLELNEPILELKPNVVVAIDEDKESTLELKELILDDNPLVVVATELDNEPILVDILELNVE